MESNSVALAAVQGDRTLAELSQQFDVHPNQITKWKRKLVEGATETFDKGTSKSDAQTQIEALHAKVGELSTANDFLECGLARFHGKRGEPRSTTTTSYNWGRSTDGLR